MPAGFVGFNRSNVENISSFVKALSGLLVAADKFCLRREASVIHLRKCCFKCVKTTLDCTNTLAPPPGLVQPITACAAEDLGHGSPGPASETSLTPVPSARDDHQSQQLIHNNPDQPQQKQQAASRSLPLLVLLARRGEGLLLLGQKGLIDWLNWVNPNAKAPLLFSSSSVVMITFSYNNLVHFVSMTTPLERHDERAGAHLWFTAAGSLLKICISGSEGGW